MYHFTLVFVALLFAASAASYLLFPASMLGIVGISSNAETDFLIHTVAVALLAFIPVILGALKEDVTSIRRSILIGLAGYMFLSSAVDLSAYVNGIVNVASVPSVLLRIVLGGMLAWVVFKK